MMKIKRVSKPLNPYNASKGMLKWVRYTLCTLVVILLLGMLHSLVSHSKPRLLKDVFQQSKLYPPNSSLPTLSYSSPYSKSAKDDYLHSEALVHPALLLHPFPRRILILGNPQGTLVQQCLLYFTLYSIDWVPGKKEERTYQDPLQKVHHHSMNVDHVSTLTLNSHFDIIIMDMAHIQDNNVVLKVKPLLQSGGILVRSLGKIEFESDAAHSEPLKQSFYYSQFRPSHAALFLYQLSTDSQAYPHPVTLHPTYINTLIQRKTSDKQNILHYGGQMHSSLFHLPTWVHSKLAAFNPVSSSASKEPVDKIPLFNRTLAEQVHMLPYQNATLFMPAIPRLSYHHELWGCDDELLSSVSELKILFKKALFYSHAQRPTSIHTHIQHKLVNVSSLDFKWGLQYIPTSRRYLSRKQVPEMIQLTAFFNGGQLSLKSFPHQKYALVTGDNSNKYTDLKEAVVFFTSQLDAKLNVGRSKEVGLPSMDSLHGDLTSWEWDIPSFTSSKVMVKQSKTSGKGHFALQDIAQGEVLFRSMVEPQLRAGRELFSPWRTWQKTFELNMAEQVEDNVYIAPSFSDLEDDKTLYSNHHCDPNMWYDGTYDVMVARRDIKKGQELTYDYATVDSEPENRFKCNCGSKQCRGIVTGLDWTLPHIQQRYQHHFFPHIRKLIAQQQAS